MEKKHTIELSNMEIAVLVVLVVVYIVIRSLGTDYEEKYESLSEDYAVLKSNYAELQEETEERLDISRTEGYEEGYESGHTDGYQYGLSEGYSEGYSEGEKSGYKSGLEDGHWEAIGDWDIWIWDRDEFREALCDALNAFWDHKPLDSPDAAGGIYDMIMDYWSDYTAP